MTVFDLTFIGVFFVTVFMLLGAAVRGPRRRALGHLRRLGIFLAAYLGVVVATSLASPRRMIQLNEPQCFDDWCVAVAQVEQTEAGSETLYSVAIRLSSRARGRPQRENGVSAYLLDARGRRYDAREDPQATPFNVLLNPGDSVTAMRRFLVPADTPDPGLVIAHGRFPGIFIIGDDQSLFHKPTVVRFP